MPSNAADVKSPPLQAAQVTVEMPKSVLSDTKADAAAAPTAAPVYSAKEKIAVAAFLVLQNSALVLCLRYSKTTTQYNSVSAVLLSEVLKCMFCLCVLLYQMGSVRQLGQHLYKEIVQNPHGMLRTAVPALLFFLQNNLLFFALEHLDAALFQVSYQGKILTTAIFSVLLMGRQLGVHQWIALGILALGVALAQWQPPGAAKPKGGGQSQGLGLCAVALATFTSGFAGVYVEKMLKHTPTDLFTRNIQLALWSIVSASVTLSAQQGPRLYSAGLPAFGEWLLKGFTPAVWTVVGLQGLAGILVAVVMKVADSIVKNFSVSVSVILSVSLSVPIFDFHPSPFFFVGSVLVLASVALYGSNDGRCLADAAAGCCVAVGGGLRRRGLGPESPQPVSVIPELPRSGTPNSSLARSAEAVPGYPSPSLSRSTR